MAVSLAGPSRVSAVSTMPSGPVGPDQGEARGSSPPRHRHEGRAVGGHRAVPRLPAREIDEAHPVARQGCLAKELDGSVTRPLELGR